MELKLKARIMMIQKHREDGPFAIETHSVLAQDWRSGKFETETVAVVYADRDQPSHSVRIFQFREE